MPMPYFSAEFPRCPLGHLLSPLSAHRRLFPLTADDSLQGQRNSGRGKAGKKEARTSCSSYSSHGEPIGGPLSNCDTSSHGEPIRGPVVPRDKKGCDRNAEEPFFSYFFLFCRFRRGERRSLSSSHGCQAGPVEERLGEPPRSVLRLGAAGKAEV